MLLVCYPKCGTCAKARAWLDANKLEYEWRDIRDDNPTAAEIAIWQRASGLPLKKFFNTSGLKYKELGLSKKLPELSEDEQLKLLATDGMLVRRPLLIDGTTVLVGFKEAEWAACLRKED